MGAKLAKLTQIKAPEYEDLLVKVAAQQQEIMVLRKQNLSAHIMASRMSEMAVMHIVEFRHDLNQIVAKVYEQILKVLGNENKELSGVREECRWFLVSLKELFEKMEKHGVGYPKELGHWVAEKMREAEKMRDG